MKIKRSTGPIGVTLVLTLSLAACKAPDAVSPRDTSSGIHGPNGADALRVSALAAADSNQLADAQLEYLTRRSIQDVTWLTRDASVKVVGFSHAFRYKSQVQVGVFNLPDGLSGAAALAEYKKSTGEFLLEMIRSTKQAVGEEGDAANRQSYKGLLDAFKLRLNEFNHDQPGIYSVRVRAPARFLAGVRAKDRTVRTVSLSDGSQKMFRAPSLPNDLGGIGPSFMIVCPQSIGAPRSSPLDGGPTASTYPISYCDPPPTGGGGVTPPPAGQGPPSSDIGTSPNLPLYVTVPISDPYTDDGFFDDNFVNNTYWAPTEGKSWVDFDNYSKFTIQHWLWKFPHLTLYLATNKRFTFEGEVHQDGRNGQQVFANGYFTARGSNGDRGEVWESNFPAPYLDTRFLDRADVPNHTVGTIAPERLQYNTFYYTWIRFGPYGGSPTGKIQIAAQLGDRDGFCSTPNGWCSLTSLSTVRVLPWICGYRAPNRSTIVGGRFKRWYYDGNGYKNEQCKDTL